MSFNIAAAEAVLDKATPAMHPVDKLLASLDPQGDEYGTVEFYLNNTDYTNRTIADALTAAGAVGIGRQQVESYRRREGITSKRKSVV